MTLLPPISLHVRPQIGEVDLIMTHPKLGEVKVGCIYLDIDPSNPEDSARLGESIAEETAQRFNAHPSLAALLERVEMVNRGVAESVELIGLAQQARLDLNT